jgi:RES domain-containing protein
LIHDPSLIDRLTSLPVESFSGSVFRATRRNLDPTTPSTAGGRWSPTDGPAVLYTSFEREGAIAEISFHWAQYNPRPTKPALIHTLQVRSDRTLRLLRSTLQQLGVIDTNYKQQNYNKTQEIGAAVAFIGCDGVIVPSARWHCDNLILFSDNAAFDVETIVTNVEEVEWEAWATENGVID